MNNLVMLLARLMLAQLFLLAGLGKLGAGYAATQGYMQSLGVPGALLPLVIALEIGGGLALVLGLFSRLAALALALFCVIAALIFHRNFGDQMQMIMFMKNFAVAGGLLLLFAQGPGALSLDARRSGSA